MGPNHMWSNKKKGIILLSMLNSDSNSMQQKEKKIADICASTMPEFFGIRTLKAFLQ